MSTILVGIGRLATPQRKQDTGKYLTLILYQMYIAKTEPRNRRIWLITRENAWLLRFSPIKCLRKSYIGLSMFSELNVHASHGLLVVPSRSHQEPN